MAGNPKKRARRAAEQRRDTVAEPIQRAGAPDAQASPPARPRASAPGTAARNVVDRAAAEQLKALADLLRPGVLVDIERTRPRWCAGSLETYELDDGNIRELWDYVREELGGQDYTFTILHTNGQPAFVTTMKVPGPPRHEGQRVTRRQWRAMMDGEDPAPVAVQAPAAAPAEQSSLLNALLGQGGLLQTVLVENNKSGERTTDAVKELAKETRETVATLVSAIGAQASQAREGNSLKGQLVEFGETMAAVDELKDQLTPEPVETAPDNTDTSGMLKTAQELFVKKVMRSMDRDGDDDRREQGRPRKRRPQNGRTSGDAPGIPDAGLGGHGPN